MLFFFIQFFIYTKIDHLTCFLKTMPAVPWLALNVRGSRSPLLRTKTILMELLLLLLLSRLSRGISKLIVFVSKHFLTAGGSKSLALYLFKQCTPGGSMHPFYFVYQLIEVVVEENWLLQNWDGLNDAACALRRHNETDTMTRPLSFCLPRRPKQTCYNVATWCGEECLLAHMIYY